MQKAKETINKSIWSSIFDCQGLLQLEVVELWDLHYSCVHCSPSIVGGLDNALRLDQLSIIDNKLTRIPARPARELVFPSPSSSSWWSVVASWLPAASCRDPRPTSPEGLLCTTISCKGFARGQSSFRIVRWIA